MSKESTSNATVPQATVVRVVDEPSPRVESSSSNDESESDFKDILTVILGSSLNSYVEKILEDLGADDMGALKDIEMNDLLDIKIKNVDAKKILSAIASHFASDKLKEHLRENLSNIFQHENILMEHVDLLYLLCKEIGIDEMNDFDEVEEADFNFDILVERGIKRLRAKKIMKYFQEQKDLKNKDVVDNNNDDDAILKTTDIDIDVNIEVEENKSSEAKTESQEEVPEKEGTHYIPTKIVVLDEDQAMIENPHLNKSDFVDLKTLTGNLKTILTVGATGCGKSTFLNSMVNHLYKVDYAAKYRWKLIHEPPTAERQNQAQSQTNQVFGYLLQDVPVLNGDNLLVIDTPGFGDSRGIFRDQQTIKELKRFFEEKIEILHGVCFTVKSSDTRLTPSQEYLITSILSIFGKDIESNIALTITFSDAGEPACLDAMREGNVPFDDSRLFKLNNSAFFLPPNANKSGHQNRIDGMFYEMGNAAFEDLFKWISMVPPKSLAMSRDVLNRREQLETNIENIRKNIDIGFNHLNKLEATVLQIQKNRSLINQNKDFIVKTKIYVTVKHEFDNSSRYTTICESCMWTCHENCAFSDDNKKAKCCAMNSNGYCENCPGKCHWSEHHNRPYTWVKEEQFKEETMKDVEKRYYDATSKKSKYEQVVDGINKEFEDTQAAIFGFVEETKTCINEISKLALRPNVLQTGDYFDLLIKNERDLKKKGWQQRMDALEKIKEKHAFLGSVTGKKFNPFEKDIGRIMQLDNDGEAKHENQNQSWKQSAKSWLGMK